MEATLVCFIYYLSMAMCWCCANVVHSTELPNYTLLLSESDFQIRLYDESSWMSARVSQGTSFEQSYRIGFQSRLYQYIHGANSDSSKIAFTAPVLTSVPSSLTGDGYIVRMFVSTQFQGKPPFPNPELKLRIEKWKSQCIAVRKFGGYAKDDNINKEIEALVSTLNKRSAIIQDSSYYTIAKYNASSHNTTGRLNEVWIKVSGLRTDC